MFIPQITPEVSNVCAEDMDMVVQGMAVMEWALH